jgi:hypothetical protein
MKLRASLIIVASVLALDAIPREAHAVPLDICLEIEETCDGHANPACTKNEDCVGADLPSCDVRHGRCVGACMWSYAKDGVLPMACPDATRPFCNAGNGRCTECTASNAAACVQPERPACVVATGSCGCNVPADCASGVCDEATRRCVAKVLAPGKSPGGGGWGGAGASSSGAPGDRPALSGYGGGTSASNSAVDPGRTKLPDALPDGGRAEGGACAMSPPRGRAALGVMATALVSMILGLVLSRRVSRRRGA